MIHFLSIYYFYEKGVCVVLPKKINQKYVCVYMYMYLYIDIDVDV